MKPIIDLKLTINTSPDSLIQFDPDKKRYEVVVPTDCFGALLRIDYAPEFYISIRSDCDVNDLRFRNKMKKYYISN